MRSVLVMSQRIGLMQSSAIHSFIQIEEFDICLLHIQSRIYVRIKELKFMDEPRHIWFLHHDGDCLPSEKNRKGRMNLMTKEPLPLMVRHVNHSSSKLITNRCTHGQL